MKVLIACEFSGIVRDEFINRGHEAVSCDIIPSEKPGPHLQDNVLDILGRGWDLMIAHPPCTYLTVSGNKWFKEQPARKSGVLVGKEREKARELSAVFFMALAMAPIDKICIENPVGYMSNHYRKPDQIIQPYMFGHPESKKTCLWLKNLSPLTPTNIVEEEPRMMLKSGKSMPSWYGRPPQSDQRQQDRSKTFKGIAEAMALQWG